MIKTDKIRWTNPLFSSAVPRPCVLVPAELEPVLDGVVGGGGGAGPVGHAVELGWKNKQGKE